MAKKVGIVGLGLMGGSLALALQKSVPHSYTFIGYDHNPIHCAEALKLGIVTEIAEQFETLLDCDILILALPVDSILQIIQNLSTLPKDITIIDLGSTKALISEAIPKTLRTNFVTAHPMTGTEQHGPRAAQASLYKDKVMVVCDIKHSGTHQQEVACALFKQLEVNVTHMSAVEHDRHAAYISHMPHALSYALANAVLSQEDNESIVALAGGGFKDMSRIAQSSPTMWEDIFRQNQQNLLESIHTLQKELKKCEKMVENKEWEALNTWMRKANTLHDIL